MDESHAAKLASLRVLLRDDEHLQFHAPTNRNLLRFLRARDWDVGAAAAQWRKTVAWRRANDVGRYRRLAKGPVGKQAASDYGRRGFGARGGVEAFPHLRLVEPHPLEIAHKVRLHCGYGNYGWDRQGRPLHWERTGLSAATWSATAKDLDADALVAGHIRQQELAMARMEEASAMFGREVTKQVIIMDLKGMSYWPVPVCRWS